MNSKRLLYITVIAFLALTSFVSVLATNSNLFGNIANGIPSRGKCVTYTNPVIDYNAPDPTVIKVDSTFYLFSTENNRETPVWTSQDLVHWKLQQKGAFLKRPSFVPNGGVWAPDVNRIGDKYVLYYAMSVWGGEWDCGIGVAVADHPEGPYVDKGKLFISKEIGVQNSIDPFFICDHGKNYLFWGSFHGIYGTELTDDGLHLKDKSKLFQIADGSIEGTYIHYRKGYYYLFGSNGRCCEGDKSTYRVMVGRSRSLLGPYVDKSGRRLLDGHYEEVLRGNDHFAGPGHNAEIVTDDKGQDWMLYHAYVRGRSDEGRQLLLDPVFWKGGWPVIPGKSPSVKSLAPWFNK
jgi:arabinan endo-1,5-alpha-L-arabinosidase